MIKFLFSCSAAWSVPLCRSLVLTGCRSALLPAVVALLPAVRPLYPAVVALLISSHCPPSSACLCFTAGSRCECVSRFTSRDDPCSTSSSRASVFDELFTRPRADPRVLLVVRWLRHPPSRSSRGVVAFFGAVAVAL